MRAMEQETKQLDSIIFFREVSDRHDKYMRFFGKKKLAKACRVALERYYQSQKKKNKKSA